MNTNFRDPSFTHCVFGPAVCKDSLCGPIPVLLKYDSGVIVYTTTADDLPQDVHHLCDPDEQGVRLSHVPMEYVQQFMTELDANLWNMKQAA